MDTGTIFKALFFGLVPLALAAYLTGARKLKSKAEGDPTLSAELNSYGWYAVIWTLSPALLASVVGAFLNLLHIIEVPGTFLVATAFTLGAGGLWIALTTIKPGMRGRKRIESVITTLLLCASLVSILTTIGIVLSVIFEAIHFFKIVNFWDFLTGTSWNPDTAFLESAGREGAGAAKPQFGSVPLFAGTFLITAIAMGVATPVGLLSAICMSEFASKRFRQFAKPTLEILAGIPTVVYGFFAAITVSPMVVNLAASLGIEADFTNALSPGLVMGIMIIPFISSLSDDIINSVPNSMREGALALGAYPSEMIKTVTLPAALPGIISAFLLGVSRAVGETMIVVMAAGLRPNLTWNPLEGVTTVTVRIVDALTGDQAFDSPETLSAFGLGLVLLVFTLILNVVSVIVIRKFKQQYE